MSCCGFLKSSIGKKVIVSLSGLFLVVFLVIHLTVNLLILIGNGEVFNEVAGFMGTNPIMKILEIVLAAGFLFHIFYTSYLTLINQTKRPVKYAVVNQCEASSWSSRNMYITGSMIFIFLVVHLINYFIKIKFTDLIESGNMSEYQLVVSIFNVEYWYFVALYIIGFFLLGLHLNHSFQSGFQTLGLNNSKWLPRLKCIGTIYTVIVVVGFTIIPVYFFLVSLLNK